MAARTQVMPATAQRPEATSVAEVYEHHFGFVWRTLRSLGVRAALLDDALQDVFVVVQRRLPEFEGRAAITTWLFSITRRVASSYRRRDGNQAWRESPLEVEPAAGEMTPRDATENAEAAATLLEILDGMPEEQREVFVAVDVEGMSAPEASGVLDVKLNTVYSRLRLARGRFEREVERRLSQQRREV